MTGNKLDMDIYVSRRSLATQPWTNPEHLPAPFNTELREENPVISNDGRLLIFNRLERGFGIFADYSTWMALRDTSRSDWSDPRPIAALNLEGSSRSMRLIGDEKSMLLFSNRTGGLGETDLYLARLVRKDAPVEPVKGLIEKSVEPTGE